MANYDALIAALVTSINQRITVKNTTDSIDPVDVGGSITDLANLLKPILNTINGFDILEGSVPPTTQGIDGDVYIQDGTNFAFWKKVNGAWVNKAQVDLGINIVDGNINVQTSVSALIVTSSAGQWGIDNVIYQTAVQTQFTIPTQDANFDRIDAVFGNKSNVLTYVAGTASSNPDGTKPTTPTDEVIIAYVYVPSIASGNLPYISDSNATPAPTPGGGGLTFELFNNDDVDVDGNITYTLGLGAAIVAVRIDQVLGGIDKVKNIWPSYEDGIIYGFDKLTSPDTQTIKVFLSGTGTAPPTPTTAELTVVVNGLPDGFEITVAGEIWNDNKKTFPIGTVLTDFTPTATGYTFDPLSIGSITMDMDKTVEFDAVSDLPALATPVLTSSNITSTTVDLDADAVTNAEAYEIDRALDSGFTTGVMLGIYAGVIAEFTDTGLTPETNYYYRITASATGYASATSSVISVLTEAAIPSLLIPKFLVDGTAIQEAGKLTSQSDNMRSIGVNTADTSVSTLAIKSIKITWDASWVGKQFVFGLSAGAINFPSADTAYSFSIEKLTDNTTITKTQSVQQVSAYNVQDDLLTEIRVRAIDDGGFWRCFIETTNDGGASPFIIRNTPAQGGTSGYLSDIPTTTNLYAQFFAVNNGVIFDNTIYEL